MNYRALLVAIITFMLSDLSQGKPLGPHLFCEANPDAPACSGSAIACKYCHTGQPPAFNAYGRCFQQSLLNNGQLFPADKDAMSAALSAFGAEDCDEDGMSNQDEIKFGSLPGDPLSIAASDPCNNYTPGSTDQAHQVCAYDQDYVYRKVWIDFCGESPSFDEYQDFKKLGAAEKTQEIDNVLDKCLDSDHWLGKDGVVWEVGHYKIRPVGSVKLGEDEGLIPIVDYYADFNLFMWSQIDGNDAREQLLADYTVTRSGGNGTPTQYTKQDPNRLLDGQVMQVERRVGLLTTFWNLSFYLNYTAVARVLVAQAFRAYTGMSMSKMQGLNPPPVEDSLYKDYDSKGMEKPECAVCHTTIDPLAYPFRNYNGLTGTSAVLQGQNATGLSSVSNLGDEENLTPLSYSKPRLEFYEDVMPGISEMPEAGYIMGQRVENLYEWAEVMANSDQFAANTVRDYWKVLMGSDVKSYQEKEFKQLWQNFKTGHNYSVEAMLRDLIRTEAYGVP
ncbi:hypothetical protein [Pseudobacteriovorax antillogorgiicola]|uniref:DUF1585 domain-containing protein n=1 Tax=Pseudobacteriovorax antillogorgiicola TaxID=1513793 RepID=A0A1Y6BLT2_9BACT|nr:hypothetical protein [Pseudobacteriovorax antillogorgiicola]TCS54566.1 hypothetical protein EDD56_10679 [Pseudobacteriovorax antillogorgiicola]SMF18210.1 hypothetical protein SAMN06296036_106164 [Pseudobacteriovorax antillogorgiicola]